MGTTAPVRQAQLRPECAERYPTLPASRWTSATCLADLVAFSGGDRPEKGRTLCEADFRFRGGVPRWSDQSLARTRAGESPLSW
jgi:hypothetical protein